MKKLFPTIFILIAFISGTQAQEDESFPPISQMKKDYKQVQIVAHVKIKSVKLAEDKGYVRYAVESEIVELFKGEIEAGKNLNYYFWAEKGYKPEKHPSEKVVFLKAEPSAGSDLFELENSGFKPSPKSLVLMRRIKAGRRTTKQPIRTRQNKIAQPGFYFNLLPPAANQSARWQNEMLKQFQSHNIEAFYGDYLSYKAITVKLKIIKPLFRIADCFAAVSAQRYNDYCGLCGNAQSAGISAASPVSKARKTGAENSKRLKALNKDLCENKTKLFSTKSIKCFLKNSC